MQDIREKDKRRVLCEDVYKGGLCPAETSAAQCSVCLLFTGRHAVS